GDGRAVAHLGRCDLRSAHAACALATAPRAPTLERPDRSHAMSQPAAATDTAIVHAALNYIVNDGIKPVNETYGPGPGGLMRKTSGTFARHVMPIHDARADRASHCLDTTGFVLADHPTRVRDFFDAD